MSVARETQASISAWAEEAFGPVSSDARVAARVNEEMSELLRYLTSDDKHPKAAEEAADVAIVLARLSDRLGFDLTALTDESAREDEIRHHPNVCIAALANARLARLMVALTLGEQDVRNDLNAIGRHLLIIARRLGTDLHTEIDRKMATNRARTWKRDGTGCGRHVPAANDARRCHACDQVRTDVGELPDSLPLCAQCAKAHRMGYRCGEEAAELAQVVDPKWTARVVAAARNLVTGSMMPGASLPPQSASAWKVLWAVLENEAKPGGERPVESSSYLHVEPCEWKEPVWCHCRARRSWWRQCKRHPNADAVCRECASEARHTEGCHSRWGARRECSCADDEVTDNERAVQGSEPYWRKLPVELRAEVLETHYLTAKECLEQTARERDQWKKGCQEWQDEGFKARARVTELEAERAAPAQDSAREELSFIVSYLAHNDQDANHAWMVRRIRAVLAGKDPGAVDPWSEHDGVRRPRRGEPVQRSGAERHQRTLALIVESAIDYLQEMGECPFCPLGESGEDLGTEAAKHEADCPLAGYELTVDIEALIAHAKQTSKRAREGLVDGWPVCEGTSNCNYPAHACPNHAQGPNDVRLELATENARLRAALEDIVGLWNGAQSNDDLTEGLERRMTSLTALVTMTTGATESAEKTAGGEKR